MISLGVGPDVPLIEVWNKLDLVDASARDSLAVQGANRSGVYPVSALTGEGVAALLDAVSVAFEETKVTDVVTLPFAQGRLRARLHAIGVVVHEEQGEDGYVVTVRWTDRQKAQWHAD